MIASQSHIFHENASAQGDGVPLKGITNASTLMLQVSGGAADLELRVYGAMTANGDYAQIAVIDMSDLSKAEAITGNGIYAAPIDGVRNVKVAVEKVSGGAVTVYGEVGE